jgi:CheY-like chemotaxis protein
VKAELKKIMPSKKILVVDDDPGIVAVLSQRLMSSGYEVCVAMDGEDAIRKITSEKPALIVMDVLMPKLTGYEVLETIRKKDEWRKIPVVIISAKGSMRDFFKDLPFVEFIPKPYDPRVLLSKVERLLWESEIQNPDGSKRVVLLGVQEALTNKIQMLIHSLGLQAFIALNEEDAFQLTQQLNPGNILCQFWEDESILNVKKLKTKFANHPLLKNVPFYVYCEERIVVEALKTFSDGRVITYREKEELLNKITELFKEA